jgi:hypothetical protein
MKYFVRIENGFVQETVIINDEVVENKEFPESEPIGIAFCKSLYGADKEYLETSVDSNFRATRAIHGMIYDPVEDVFKYPTVEEEITE